MVTFKLIRETDELLIYWYYPEGRENTRPGVIEVNKLTEEINIVEIAEGDRERDIPAEELNQFAMEINQMKRERGAADFVEMVTEPVHSVYYGDHAVREIAKYLQEGKVPQKGMQAWY